MQRADLKISPTHGTVGLRPAAGSPSKEAFLYLLFASNRAAEMALMPLAQHHKEFLLQVQFRSMNETYRRNFPNARYEIIELIAGRSGESSARSSATASTTSTSRCCRKRKGSASARPCSPPLWRSPNAWDCRRGSVIFLQLDRAAVLPQTRVHRLGGRAALHCARMAARKLK